MPPTTLDCGTIFYYYLHIPAISTTIPYMEQFMSIFIISIFISS